MADTSRVFTREELAKYNGKDGNPVYIAYEGKVYDVTTSKMWRTGMHMKLHNAGNDLSGEMEAAPHDTSVLERYPRIGTIMQAPAAEPVEEFEHLPGFLAGLLKRIPFLERHPHPMTVHFPIVFSIAAPLFVLLYLITGIEAFESTSLHILGAGALFCLVAIPTGFLTWWVNYQARPVKAVVIKIVLSVVLLGLTAFAFILRLLDPEILRSMKGNAVIYLIAVFALLPVVSVIGWYGATLTFPLPHKAKPRKDKST